MRKNLFISIVGLLVSTLLFAQGPGRNTQLQEEYIENPDCHDPVVAYCDGTYYMFTTGMGVMSSPDQKKWRREASVFTRLPQWAVEKGFRGMPWAPDIIYHNGQIGRAHV